MQIHWQYISLQGDTLQNVARQLHEIFETGHYSFKLPIHGEAELRLEYTPADQTSSTELSTESETGSTIGDSIMAIEKTNSDDIIIKSGGEGPMQEQWNSEQIGDFVRKLGFIDLEKEGGEKIKHFRYINTVSSKNFE